MRSGAWLSLGFAVTLAAEGCSSTSGVPAGSFDSGVASSDSETASSDSGTDMACDGSLPTMGAGAGADCTACRVKSCVSQAAACAADCACGPIEACLETSARHNFTECPNAVAAATGGNPPLTMLTMCLDANCLSACFSGGGGADAGGGDP